jgi:hypothetical protein
MRVSALFLAVTCIACSRGDHDRAISGVRAERVTTSASPAAALRPSQPAPQQAAHAAASTDLVPSIGEATMKADRTIGLRLRAESPEGFVGEGYFEYRPGDKDYDDVLKHLGGIAPGETKPVAPWPDT